jgi:peptide/nickel transport system permease protein
MANLLALQANGSLRWATAVTGGTAGRVGLVLVTMTAAIVLCGPFVAPNSPTALVGPILQGPSLRFPLGTDQLGRDVLSRVLCGGQSVLLLPLLAVGIAFATGGSLGLLVGYRGGLLDQVVTRLADLLMSVPPLLLVLVIIAALGTSDLVLIGVTGIWFAPRIVRVVRGVTASIVARDFVLAAQARGESEISILWHEVMPNITGTLLAEMALRLNYAIIFITTLNFLGLGVQPPSPDWGLMVSEGRAYLSLQPLVALVPAALIACLAIGVNLISDQIGSHLARNVQANVRI